jgi:Protein of unknown function (DUF4235)
MAGRRQSRGWQIFDGVTNLTADGITAGLAALAATFVARKVLTVLWTKATGKEPPVNPEDPQVALPEALSWSMLMGLVLGTARVLAVRAARSSRSRPARESIDAVDS